MSSQLDNIRKELDRINKPNWVYTVKTLEENFHGYPLNEDQMPASAILNILKSLEPDNNVEERFLNRVHNLDCFTYRAYYLDETNNNEAIYWNPLVETFETFSKNSPINYQTDVEYPATDIINQWIWKQIKQ